jgi:SAM-dependent methyltransferase
MISDRLIRRSLQHYAGGALRWIAGLLRPVLSLKTRKYLATLIERRRLPGHFYIFRELLADLKTEDPNAFHRFLWSRHLAYAASYEVTGQFGSANIDPTRHILLKDIAAHLRSNGLDPARDIQSVFDVGCSLGHVLRYVETDIFPAASTLRGLDIDDYAVKTGTSHLRRLNSRIELTTADMVKTDSVMGQQHYDVVLCCGVLMYLDEKEARGVVRTMISHAKHAVGIICLGHPHIDNAFLNHSGIRPFDGSFIHNLDRMILQAGGRVISRRWGEVSTRGGSSACIVVAAGGNKHPTPSSSATTSFPGSAVTPVTSWSAEAR